MDLQKVKNKPTFRDLTLKIVNTLHNLKTKLATGLPFSLPHSISYTESIN